MKACLLIILTTAILSGCAQAPYHGEGEFFQLKTRHVVYQDLTVPVSPDNAPTPAHLKL